MKYSFDIQGDSIKAAVQTLQRGESHRNMPTIMDALKESEVTMRALALMEKRIAILDDLIKVSQEFVMDRPSMELGEILEYQKDFKELLNKIK